MTDVFETLPDEVRGKLKEREPPRFPTPMLATLTEQRFSDKRWIFERKLDGERCLAVSRRGDVRLVSRNRNVLNDTYPELEAALSSQTREAFVLDGEIVAFSGNATSFARLQRRMKIEDRAEASKSDVRVFYYLFDLLHLDGYDITAVGLRHRKGLLRRAFRFTDPLRFTAHRNENGVEFYRDACHKGWEGIIAKDAQSEYVSSRSKKWLKFKCVQQQELVIGGYTDPEGKRIGLGALLVGYYDDGALVYAGKVGTGYDDETLERLSGRLRSMERRTAPFARGTLPRKGVHWVTPKLVGQFGFTEWTDGNRLRHPRFLGLRRDKKPREVVRESPREAS